MPSELHEEIKRGNTGRVRELLRAGADVNAIDGAGCTPLMVALERPAAPVEIVKLLLEHGADVRYTREHGYDALMDAALRTPRAHLLDILKMLIARGAPLHGVSSYRETALRVLAWSGRFDAVQLLLDAGADGAQLKWTPLHRAVALGSMEDVRAAAGSGADLEAVDCWERTPWLVAVKTGDLEKARYLVERGADVAATGRGGASPLELAIDSGSLPMLRWLTGLGVSVESTPDCCITPLMHAVREGVAEAVDVLIAAGADIDRETPCGTALGHVGNRENALRLLEAGADPANLSFEGRRAILGLPPEPDPLLFDASPADFRAAPKTRWGRDNPERMDEPFWLAMIRSGIIAYAASQIAGGTPEDSPVWCAQRFGQSLTLLPDGRAIQVGGEHEDFYDSDFCIYNDVFVHYPEGRVEIYGYPEDVFPPTDFHTATLIGNSIYLIGSLGYRGSRRYGETPVHCLDVDTLRMSRLEITGEPPGWISGHRADLVSSHEIRVSGGKIVEQVDGKEVYRDNERVWIFDAARREWR